SSARGAGQARAAARGAARHTCRRSPARARSAGLRRPPLIEPSVGLLLAQRPLVEAKLQQVVEGLAHQRPGADAQVGHHLVAVEVGTDGVELLLAAQLV